MCPWPSLCGKLRESTMRPPAVVVAALCVVHEYVWRRLDRRRRSPAPLRAAAMWRALALAAAVLRCSTLHERIGLEDAVLVRWARFVGGLGRREAWAGTAGGRCARAP